MNNGLPRNIFSLLAAGLFFGVAAVEKLDGFDDFAKHDDSPFPLEDQRRSGDITAFYKMEQYWK
ncbi:hypothetical protein [Hydrogenispora ethanolica]|uniref:hypothetical protein n=1 Tax=Hydrogenispora ethanolica TaxID=1082276 RepID=UPI001404DA11|nr:hypothetical protein [Hydrogenispora ethanolica]